MSVAVGSGKVTAIEVAVEFGASVTTTLLIESITGGVVSFVTVTFTVALEESPPLLVTLSVKLASIGSGGRDRTADLGL